MEFLGLFSSVAKLYLKKTGQTPLLAETMLCEFGLLEESNCKSFSAILVARDKYR